MFERLEGGAWGQRASRSCRGEEVREGVLVQTGRLTAGHRGSDPELVLLVGYWLVTG